MEICVDSLALAEAAAWGGADRIELCGSLHDGGITASAGLAAAARRRIEIPIAMLIRPRTGPFTVSPAEFAVMREDILYARDIGMDLVVLGILLENGTVDVERTSELVRLAYPMQVTFHRAFDATRNLDEALGSVIQTGATRILTSGGKQDAVLGAPTVARLRESTQNRIGLLLCGGVSAATAFASMQASGSDEVHAALRHCLPVDPSGGPLKDEDLKHFSRSVQDLRRSVDKAQAGVDILEATGESRTNAPEEQA